MANRECGEEAIEEQVDSDSLRRALRRWPSGVTVVTVGDGDAAHGLTVSAFCSVSVEPPMILVCISRRSRVHDILSQSPFFAVNILSAGQQDISQSFAKPTIGPRLAGIAHRRALAIPCVVLDGAAAVLECRVAEKLTSGDHATYFGRVVATDVSQRDPLLYFDGGYQNVIFGRRKLPR